MGIFAVRDINVSITTFNAGRDLIDVDYFASSLYTTFQSGQLPPDLVVLALQEIAPLGYSFLGRSLLVPYLSNIHDAVLRATEWALDKDADYEHVITRNAGMTAIVVLARRAVKDRIRWIEEAGTGVGIWEMGNKGAVAIRLGLGSAQDNDEDVPLTFVAAHLAPMEEAWGRRNEDWKNICQTLVFESADTNDTTNSQASERQPLLSDDSSPHSSDSPHSIYYPPSHVFIAGDLNYRTADSPPDPKDFESWPQPLQQDSDPAHWSKLLEQDQLTRELRANRTLHHLSEAPITFPPTYKYSSRAQQLAAKTAKVRSEGRKDSDTGLLVPLDGNQEQVYLWAKHRVPSWCDRILYLSTAEPTVHSYTALPVQPTSDHRPVTLSFSIPDKPLDASQAVVASPFEVAKDWRERREFAKRVEFMVGLGGYLGFTGQGRVLTAGTVVGIVIGYLALRYMLGH